MNGWGASTQKRCPYGQADGFFRHQRDAASVPTAARPRVARSLPTPLLETREADPVLARVQLQEDDRVEVHRGGPVRGLDLGPAPAALDVFAEPFVGLL